MKSVLLTLSSLLIAVQSASILPIDSSASVQVKSNGNEYAYTIQENKAIPLEPLHGLPIIEHPLYKILPQEQLPLVDLKTSKEKDLLIQNQGKLIDQGERLKPEGQGLKMEIDSKPLPGGQISEQKLEKPLEQLYITGYPGYRLIPSTEYQLLEYPYYYPYLNNYAYHYPHIRFL